MSDTEIVRLVRQTVGESEQRQSSELARQILQVSRDTEAARRADFDRLLTTYRQQPGTGFDTSQRQQGALESISWYRCSGSVDSQVRDHLEV